ncbi:c-type cytochrome [Sulfuriflexus mobilis]|uniref:c-type cytochrome n=1 Tax=Sulfuriflexus mobilis TaxID=1811807 RepID=UPI0018D4DC76|nr:cytochrome c [Sulfuriflexus mobilis]
MMAKLITLSALMAASLFITACDKPADSAKQAEEKQSAEPMAARVESPPVIDPQLAAEGQRLYEQNCIFCHQADAIGKPGIAPSLTNKEFLSVASNKFLLSTIRDGRVGTGMPPYSHLGKENIEAIVAYLRDHATLTDRSAEVDAQPATQGDPRLGKLWFDQLCLTCHGTHGDGYSAGGTGTAIGKAGFLSKASDGFIRTTIKEGRSNTRMLGFFGAGPSKMADLSEREIDDIIAYLRTVPSQN